MLLSYTTRALALSFLFLTLAISIRAQAPTPQGTGSRVDTPGVAASMNSAVDKATDNAEVQRQLREQQQEMERMRAMLSEQTRVINDLRLRVEETERAVTSGVVKTNGIVTSDTVSGTPTVSQDAAKSKQITEQDGRIAKVEEQTKKNTETIAKQLGSLTFSGDMRMRYESFYGLLNSSANDGNPAILGNPLTTRQRFRVRARLSMSGQFGKEFDLFKWIESGKEIAKSGREFAWGLRLATGSFADSVSTNQTLTDFYNRKPIGVDQAYIAWTPEIARGLRFQVGKFGLQNQQAADDKFFLQGDKFEVPWLRTEMTLDNDLQVEGFNETYSYILSSPKNAFSNPSNITFVAMQLPLLERNSSFVRNANGTVNLGESKRAGRDLALYAAQLHGRFEFSKNTAITLSISDLYFSGTQFISPIQVFGSNLLLPVTFTIPATATTPAQTITTQVSIPRDLLVAGNGNLGLSTASNNAVNRDGRLASGYNLVDIIGRLDWTRNKNWPVTFIFDFVTNTQTHDVVVAGAGGENAFLKNNENSGYYAELQVGKQKERGDIQIGYTFMRVEKDAVLTPFNISDVAQQSDFRNHRFNFNYAADKRVLLSIIGIITERPNGLLGVFGTTPPGSLNRPTTRLQFDTTFKF